MSCKISYIAAADLENWKGSYKAGGLGGGGAAPPEAGGYIHFHRTFMAVFAQFSQQKHWEMTTAGWQLYQSKGGFSWNVWNPVFSIIIIALLFTMIVQGIFTSNLLQSVSLVNSQTLYLLQMICNKSLQVQLGLVMPYYFPFFSYVYAMTCVMSHDWGVIVTHAQLPVMYMTYSTAYI